MKAIFLDIDGVLNTTETHEKIDGEIAVEDSKLSLLKALVDQSGAKIVLVSTTKIYWQKECKDKQGVYGKYLDEKFAEFGLSIFDKTNDDGLHRGLGVLAWKAKHRVSDMVVLDDNECGYDAVTKMLYLVHISGDAGLTEKDIEKAKEML